MGQDVGDPAARVEVVARRDGRAVRITVGEIAVVMTPVQAQLAAEQLDSVLDELTLAPQVRTPARLLHARISRHLGIAQAAADRLADRVN